ncbi:MAG TPA: amidohydrolase family protein [Acidimicrobiales bacterium]|nr:amidohydrolase family protein [Acidimicrobiales bacterium]
MTARPELAYGAIDADNHFYENRDSFTRHLEPKFEDQAIHLVGEGPKAYWMVGERRYSFSNINNVDWAPAPGSREEFFAAKQDQTFVERAGVEMIDPKEHPPLVDKSARLELMDAQGLDAILQVPTMAVMLEPDYTLTDDGWYANIRAFNRWAEDEWGFGTDGRIFSTALISPRNPDLAVEELERVAAAGAKFVVLGKAGPIQGRSPADRIFDRFWAAIQDLDLITVQHIGNSGYTELFSAAWGEDPHPFLRDLSPFQHFTCLIDRPIADTMANLVLNNLFGRFPKLKMVVLEYGSRWVWDLLPGIDKAAKMGAQGRWPGGKFTDLPSDVFKEHVWVSPFPEEDPVALLEMLPADRLLFGSDYPHSEGLREPLTYASKLAGLDDDTVHAILRGNAARLMGLAA